MKQVANFRTGLKGVLPVEQSTCAVSHPKAWTSS